jgi:hypothetical protein
MVSAAFLAIPAPGKGDSSIQPFGLTRVFA